MRQGQLLATGLIYFRQKYIVLDETQKFTKTDSQLLIDHDWSRSRGLTDCTETLNRRSRLQNSPYFCVFKYARAVKQKVWNEAENRERDWGETLKIRAYGRVRLARLARVRLLRHALPISLLTLRKKPTVLQSIDDHNLRSTVYMKTHYFFHEIKNIQS